MNKSMNYSTVVEELHALAKQLEAVAKGMKSIADSVLAIGEGAGQPESKPAVTETVVAAEKVVTLEQVRAVLSAKSYAGLTDAVRALLNKYGATKLSGVDPKDYKALLEEAEVLGNGGK